MCEKVTRVSQWLQKIFGAEKVPEFEVNARAIDILDHLVKISEERCGDVQLLIGDHRQKAAEYRADSAHFKELLQSVDLKPESDSKPAFDFLSVLEGIADVLKVKDTAMGSFISAINEQSRVLTEAENTHRRLDWELLAMRKNFAAMLLQKKELHEVMKKIKEDQQLEAAAAEQKLLNKDFSLNKAMELKLSNKIAKDELASRNMDRSLEHEAIVQLSNDVTEVEQQIKSLEKELEAYNDLSPSPDLALVKIEEAKRELAALDSKLDSMIDLSSL